MNKPVNCRCGGEVVVEKHQLYEEQIEDMFIVRCVKCDIQTSPEYKKEKAIEIWNRAMGERTAIVKDFGHPCGTYGYCSNCDGYCVNEEPYCPHCGAKIKWE